jgi:hypothetical protein
MSLTMLDLNGDARARTEPAVYSTEPLPPLRRIWVGFGLAFAFLVAEIVETIGGNTGQGLLTTLIALSCSIYWLTCVQRFHTILNQLSPQVDGQSTYPITSRQAVVYHFIPFYNLVWIFKWPATLATFLRESFSISVTSGGALGLLLLLGLLLTRVFDGFVGFTCIFFVCYYISRKLRQAMDEHERMRVAAETFT